MSILVVCVTLLCPAELIVEGALGVIGEGHRRLASDHGSRLLAHLLSLQIALKRIEEESVMRNGEPRKHKQDDGVEYGEIAIPVEDLLFLLCANTLILKQEVKER